MFGLDRLDTLFVIWAFSLQIILIIHFAIRKSLFESYTKRFGWIIYALCLPALILSIVLLVEGKSWSFWLGGFLFVIWSAYGYWIDYIKGINWRKPLRKDIMFPYVTLYLSPIMFYWWPLALLYKPLWYVFGVLFVIGSVLNIRSH
ncbi:MAG: hypothetical protein DRJ13_14270 [Bacteroidetes bacterium]|nr:MAG: hypothetical protein DRJ13_14270 [Bacteroidota bacterium]